MALNQPDNVIPQLERPESISSEDIGKYCIVVYDNRPYPGTILSIEEDDIEVKCMHKVGKNRFFWPSPREDITWYKDDQVLCLIPEPKQFNRRSFMVDSTIWNIIEEQYD